MTTTSSDHDDNNACQSPCDFGGGSESASASASAASAAANDNEYANEDANVALLCDSSDNDSSPTTGVSWIHPTSCDLYTRHIMLPSTAMRIAKRVGVLRYSLNHAWTVRKSFPNALFTEFGVHEGKDICRIAAHVREKERQEKSSTRTSPTIVHGFDSFQGLPEDWDNGQRVQAEVEVDDHDHIHSHSHTAGTDDSNNTNTQNTQNSKNTNTKLAFGKGTFDLGGVVPDMESVQQQLGTSKFFHLTDDNNNDINKNDSCNNVQLHPGWFHDTVSPFFDDQQQQSPTTPIKVAFLHADADLYSSTVTFLEEICRRRCLVAGSVIVFDEYANYSGWEKGEYRAWTELSTKYGLEWKYLCYHGPKTSGLSASPNKWSAYGYQSVSVVITAVPDV
jgi:hypothetical protein